MPDLLLCHRVYVYVCICVCVFGARKETAAVLRLAQTQADTEQSDQHAPARLGARHQRAEARLGHLSARLRQGCQLKVGEAHLHEAGRHTVLGQAPAHSLFKLRKQGWNRILAALFIQILGKGVFHADRFDRDVRLQTPLCIYDNQGTLVAEYGNRRRIPVRLPDVPQAYIDATLSIEDKRFFQHGGIDPVSMFNAVGRLLHSGAFRGGAITITMQLARNLSLGCRLSPGVQISQ